MATVRNFNTGIWMGVWKICLAALKTRNISETLQNTVAYRNYNLYIVCV